MIPRIIHQTWKKQDLPERYQRWAQTFRRRLPNWEYRLWDDADCLQFVHENFPQDLRTYQGLSNPAQKSDLFRYMVLFVHGGLYADIDCECKRPLDFISDNDEFIAAVELQTTDPKIMELYPTDLHEIYCQWAFLARPEHPVLAGVIEQIRQTGHQKWSDNPILDVVKRTGPHVFTKILKQFLAKGSPIKILPASFFGCCDGRNMFRFALSFFFPTLFRKVYIRHHFEGSWIDKKVKREMFRRNLAFSAKRKKVIPRREDLPTYSRAPRCSSNHFARCDSFPLGIGSGAGSIFDVPK